MERSLFAQGHVKMISFFFRLWHPYAFHLFKCNFLGAYWSISSNFCINLRCVHYHFPNFRLPRFFFGELLAIKISDFLEGKRYIFESCLYSKLGNAKIFALFDGAPLSCDNFCRKVFSVSSRQKKRKKIFPEQIWYCPLRFSTLTLIFYKLF